METWLVWIKMVTIYNLECLLALKSVLTLGVYVLSSGANRNTQSPSCILTVGYG